MERQIVRPAALDLDSPGRRDYWIILEHDSTWGEHYIPLTVWVGPEAEPGKGLVAFGSNHGNEYEGAVALKKLLREIAIEDVRGRIILVPVLNPAAFWCGQRESREDDGVNLNRAFVDGAGSTPALSGITHRIAALVREYIWPRVHVVLDIHAGGEPARFALCTSFHPLDDPEQTQLIHETAAGFGTPFTLIYQNATPGLLPLEAERLGKITVGSELGWGEAVSEDGVRFARQGVLSAAIRHRQLRSVRETAQPGVHKPRLVSCVADECTIRAPYAGHYEPLLPCGTRVERGHIVGLLHDFARIDEEPLAIKAGVDGYVIAEAWHAPVRQGYRVLVVGSEVEL
jgi:N-alpha-acetyl-L-2,4-diaminobutyrate deacetylase